MFTRIEALGFRCLRDVRQSLASFQVLVGPNASGKTTFLDVIAFLGLLVDQGPEATVAHWTANLADLVWKGEGRRFELAVEARVPDELRSRLVQPELGIVRYEVGVGSEGENGGIAILAESVLLLPETDEDAIEPAERPQFELFPRPTVPRDTLLSRRGAGRPIVSKVPGGNDNYYSEVYGQKGKGWVPSFRFGPQRSALGNLPADETKFPVAMWLRDLLTARVEPLVLNSRAMRLASRPNQAPGFRPDGSNLPWVVDELLSKSRPQFDAWLAHVRTALPDVAGFRVVERPDDRHKYLVIRYEGGYEVPSWMVSDGTLRLLALTLPAYLPDFRGVYLIEEPENGIHPQAVETVVQSLSSAYDAQILVASHSPVVLGAVPPENILCFAKDAGGATDIVAGRDHPALRDWRGETSLATLFAAGVLG